MKNGLALGSSATCLALAYLAAGCSSTVSSSSGSSAAAAPEAACDGSGPAVPEGYPALGPGCLSHFTFRDPKANLQDPPKDESSARGLRPMPAPATGFDVGVQEPCPHCSTRETVTPVWLFLPSLSPGRYWYADGASVVATSSFASHYNTHGVLIVIEGASDEAVWGRFLGKACEMPLGSVYTPSDPWEAAASNPCEVFAQGLFAAGLEDVESELEMGDYTPPPKTHVAGGPPPAPLAPCDTFDDCDGAPTGACSAAGCVECKYGICR